MNLCHRAIASLDLSDMPQTDGIFAILDELSSGLGKFEKSEFCDGHNCYSWITSFLDNNVSLHYDSKNQTLLVDGKVIDKPSSDLPTQEEVGADYDSVMETSAGPLLYNVLLSVGTATANLPTDDRKMPSAPHPMMNY